MTEVEEEEWHEDNDDEIIDESFKQLYDKSEKCSVHNLNIQSNINTIEKVEIIDDDDYNVDF